MYKEESAMADKGSNAEKILKNVLQVALDVFRNSKKKGPPTWGELANYEQRKYTTFGHGDSKDS